MESLGVVRLMNPQLNILRHPKVDESLRTLPSQLANSLEEFEQTLRNDGDLSPFTHTKPYSAEDALGNRTGIRHYHLLPCRPNCYLVWLVRTGDLAYILEVSLHPEPKEFTSIEVEERLYTRLAELCPELSAYELPGSYRYVFPVRKRDKFGARTTNSTPYLVPVRTTKSDFLPLGQLGNLEEGRNRIGVVIGTFEIPADDMPEAALECTDYEDHPERDMLTLFIGGWTCHSGIYRPETQQLVICLCPLHRVVLLAGSRSNPVVFALSKPIYQWLEDGLKGKFPVVQGKENELNETVNRLIEYFPLHRP